LGYHTNEVRRLRESEIKNENLGRNRRKMSTRDTASSGNPTSVGSKGDAINRKPLIVEDSDKSRRLNIEDSNGSILA